MFNFLFRVTPAQYAARSLVEAQMVLLKALSEREYMESLVTQKMTEIKRLEKFLGDLEAKTDARETHVEGKRLNRVFSVLKPKQVAKVLNTPETKNATA